MNYLKITIATLIFVMSFAMQISEAEAILSCPSGMSNTVVTIMVDGCAYDVELCYSCSMTSAGEVRIMSVTKVNPYCYSALNPNQVLQYVYSTVSTYQFIYQNLCPTLPDDPTPCPDGVKVEIKSWVCWKIEMINYLGEETLKYSPCNYDAYCDEIFLHCWDANQQKIVKIYEKREYVGEPSCTLEAWEITIPQNVGEVSDCYIYHTPCDE